jgi:hypothetical protein
MTTPKGALRTWLFAAALTLTTTNPIMAMSVPAAALFGRDDTCGDTSYTKCSQAGLPDNFCCSPSSTCIPLAGNTTILCCPTGSDCSTIAPIVCNVQLQDATAYPQAVVKTTVLTGELPKCGSNCCPFGYTCDSTQNCIQDKDQSKKPSDTSGGTTTTAAATATSGATHASTSVSAAPETTSGSPTAAPATTDPAASTTSRGGTNTGAIVGGVVGSFAGLAILALILVCLRRRQTREKQRRRDSERSFISKDVTKISAPIPHDKYTHGRTDFTAKSYAQAHSLSSAHTTPSQFQEGFQESFRGYNEKPPPSSSYSNSFHSYPTSATAVTTGGGGGGVDDVGADKTKRSMEEDARSYHPSAIVRDLRLSRFAKDVPRQPSDGSGGGDDHEFEDINIFADPMTVPDFSITDVDSGVTTAGVVGSGGDGLGGGLGADLYADRKRDTAMTRWTSLQREATVRK